MNGFLDFVFGLNSSGAETLGMGDEGVRFEMTRELPSWVWVPLIVGVIGLAALSYWRISGGLRGRVVLACSRALLLVVLLLVAAGPRLVRDNERVERDAVAVLVDRSASMAMPDGAGDSSDGATRDAQLRRVVGDEVWARLGEQHDLVWLGFDASAYEIDPASIGDADGARTRIGGAVRSAMERLSGRPVGGVVVVSDGRTSDAPDARLLRELSASRVGVFAVPLGSEEALVDIGVEGVDAPTSAFVGDFVPVTARLTARGAVAERGEDVRVTLVDTATGIELDAQDVAAEAWVDGVAEVRLATRPEVAAATARWSVRIEPAGGRDLLAENNERGVEVELIDRPLRVLYFEGYPRWEYRYVKDLLVRESSIRSSVMLLATDRRYIQEGDVGLPYVPRSSGEWGEFDVVMIGDVRPDVFSTEQLEQLRDQVAERGAGLVWMAGPGATPWRWAATPLGDLLPFTAKAEGGDSAARGFGTAEGPVTLRREEAAGRLGVLEMGEGAAAGWLASLSDAGLNWPVLRWSLAIEPSALKATAEVLASAVPVDSAGEAGPAVMTMRYGAGRVVFVGTDEIWRWRYARGEALPERFYLPLVRLAGRGSVARSGRSVVLEALPGVVSVGTPVRLGAVLLDQSLVDAAPPAVRVRVTRSGERADDSREAAEISLGAEAGGQTGGDGGRSGARTASYAASWVAGEPGEYLVEAADPLLAAAGARARFRVVSPDDERRVPEADHALLADLAERTGGAVVGVGDLARLADLVPNRSVVVVGEPDVETLWDKPVVLAVLVLLLGFEWVGRRLLKLA